MIAKFRIVQLSDMHFGTAADMQDLLSASDITNFREIFARKKRGKVSNASSAQDDIEFRWNSTCGHRSSVIPSIATFMEASRNKVSGVLITGDISRTGNQADLNAAMSLLEEANITQKGSNGDRKHKVHLLPGNHDRWDDEFATPGGVRFDDVFTEFWPSGIGGVQVFEYDAIPSGTDYRGKLFVVAGDFSLRSRDESFAPSVFYQRGQGFAYRDTIELMVAQTNVLKARYKSSIVVWTTHFPPESSFKSPLELDFLTLVRGQRLVDAARQCEISLILCGHIHEPKRIDYGDVQILCAGSASCVSKKGENYLHLLELELNSESDWRFLFSSFAFDNSRSGFIPNYTMSIVGRC